MIRIKVELVPGGVESRVQELGRAELGSLADTAAPLFSDYSIAASETKNLVADTPAWEIRGTITNHDRRLSIWALVARVGDFVATQAEGRAGRG